MIADYLFIGLIGYLFGSIPTGLVVGYLFTGGDIRARGSGKTGTTNVLRTAGPVAAAIVVIIDIAKGTIPAVLGRVVFDDFGVASFGAALGMVGHVFPVFAGFRGGRGVATAYGGLIGLVPMVALVLPIAAALILGVTRYVSLMSIMVTVLAAGILAGLAIGGALPASIAWFGVFAVVFIVYMHRPNIERLLHGTEPKIGKGGDRPASG